MSIFDEDIGAGLASVEGVAGVWPPPEAARVATAEAGCEELRRTEMDARSRAGSLKWQLDKCRDKLTAAEQETKAVRRTAKNALALQSEVTRLKNLLSEAGVESSKRSTIMSLRMEVARLRRAVPASEAVPRAAPRRSRNPEETIASLREDNARLKKDVRAAKNEADRVKFLDRELDNHRHWLRGSHDRIERIEARHRDEVDWLNKDIAWLREALGRAADKRNDEMASLRKQFDRRLAAAKRIVEARERTIAWLRERNDRLRAATVRATELIASLREKNARLRAEVRDLEGEHKTLASRVEALQAQLARLRSTRSVLSKALFGSRSEKQDKPGTGRKRGQQRGAPGHGRTQRPGLREKKERRNPPKDARMCSCCGKPYVANGERSTTVIEIEVKAHTRRIVRPRWRRGCDCPSSALEVTAPPVARLFDNTPYGTSVWARFLFEHCVCLRPLSRIAAWMADQGLAVSPGTLADSLKRFVPLFEPLAAAILAHQNTAPLRHADETGWRVQEFRDNGRSSRAWLWTSVSKDAVYFLIDPSRSAEVAKTLFGDTVCKVFVVCDRYSAYRKLARELGGKVILCWCWAHQRRTFIDCAVGHVRLTRWCQGWIERIAEIYRLNEARLEHYDPGLERQTPAFDAAQGKLEAAIARLFADAEAELAGLSKGARRAKALRSILNHREGLCVFVDNPQVPMDNNVAERALRAPIIGRRLSFGSNSEDGAKFKALTYSVVGTLSMHGIDVRRWLEAWLKACAKNGGKPPDDLSPWLPWSMNEERKRKFTAPG